VRELSVRKVWTARAKNSLVPYTPEEALSLRQFLNSALNRSV